MYIIGDFFCFQEEFSARHLLSMLQSTEMCVI